MFRLGAFVALIIALSLGVVGPALAAPYGTPDEAKALLEKAVVAVKEDKAKALGMFNKQRAGSGTVTAM
jgi:hypothetical protein